MLLKFSLLLFALMYIAANAASVDLTCRNKVGGAWNFGTAPSACNVSPAANTPATINEYASVIFADSHTNSAGRRAYMSAMYPFLRDFAIYYIQRRNPKASDAEVTGFVMSIFALAEQETLWTHYREGTDNILRYMRGDGLHGHGLMQVDDRSHTAALKAGRGVDLAYNLVYGFDVYYKGWLQSASAKCVSSSSNFHDRARAAWASYNGGPGAICRWTKNGTADKSYNTHYVQKEWLPYVSDTSAASGINVKCLAEGVRPCAQR